MLSFLTTNLHLNSSSEVRLNNFATNFASTIKPNDNTFYQLYSWHDMIFLKQLITTNGLFGFLKNVVINLPLLLTKSIIVPAINWLIFNLKLIPYIFKYVLFSNNLSMAERLANLDVVSGELMETIVDSSTLDMDLMGKIYQREHLYFREVLFHALDSKELSYALNYTLVHKYGTVVDTTTNVILTINNNATTLAYNVINKDLELKEYQKLPTPLSLAEAKLKLGPLFSAGSHDTKDSGTVLNNYSHPFHLVDPSPWPFCTSMALWYMALTVVSVFHNYVAEASTLLYGLVYLIFSLAAWWRDVIRESTYEFKHTPYVRRGLLLGMTLFIISEVMFFFGFFWAFFHSSLVPSPYIGGVWPPHTLSVVSPWELPLVNTLCLLLSGVTLTISHRQLNGLPYYNHFISVRWQTLNRLITWLQVTIFLGVFFLGCQAFEYYYAGFTFQDTVYGGTFYILTGLHGMHVLVGTIFLIVCLWRASRLHFTLWKQVGFKSAVWYWHFVDVVWIFLYLVIYIWGNGAGN